MASDRNDWAKWLDVYGPRQFFDSFMRHAQGAISTCEWCGRRITLDIAEGGGVADWGDNGDYGCVSSPDTSEEGTGGHAAIGTQEAAR